MSKFGNKGLQRLKARTKGPAKHHGPAHCDVDYMHSPYWNDMRKRNAPGPGKEKSFGVGATDAKIASQKNKDLKSAATFAAQEGVGQLIKRGLGKAAAGLFGAAGMLLTPTTVYAGGKKESGSKSITDKELKEQSGLIPEETSEQFQARNATQSTS